jgi:hypothetical protein
MTALKLPQRSLIRPPGLVAADFQRVEGKVYGSVIKIALWISLQIRRELSSKQSQKDRLQNVVGIFTITHHGVGRAIDQGSVFPEYSLTIRA